MLRSGSVRWGTLCLILSSPLAWAGQQPDLSLAGGDLPAIHTHGNQTPAGQLENGLLTIRLEVREGKWYPQSELGAWLPMQAFAEEGQPAQVPGPLIRVPQGTEIHATVRNRLATATAKVYGLHSRPGRAADALEIASGETREVRFKVDTPGTYYYWATTTGETLARRIGADSQLAGALVVDPLGAAPVDQVFVISLWFE